MREVQSKATEPAVLVVDDQADFRSFMQATLESAGYDVRTAPEGEAALALQRSRAADLLITDIFMPGLEGFETVTAFKEQFPVTKIIVMSAGFLPGLKHDFLASAGLLGIGASLRKPFTAGQLLETVREVLRRRRTKVRAPDPDRGIAELRLRGLGRGRRTLFSHGLFAALLLARGCPRAQVRNDTLGECLANA